VRARHLLGLASSALLACDASHAPDATRLAGATMGTTYAIVLAAPLETAARAQLQAEVDALLEGVEARMSTWRDDSELSRFNRAETTDWFPVSAETAGVAAEALRVSALTDGAFDPTLAPVIELWGFGPHEAATLPPPDAALAAARARVGFARLAVRAAPPALRKRAPDLALDFSGVAKGYAVDAVALRLERAGIASFLVEIGGELRAAGRRADGPWRVAIERPALRRGSIQEIVSLEDAAIATSGSYRNFATDAAGRRYPHLLDPRSGRPVQGPLVSVSVIAASAARADALATGLFVLGDEAGLALARREGLAVLFLSDTPDGLVERATPGFEAQRLGRRGDTGDPSR